MPVFFSCSAMSRLVTEPNSLSSSPTARSNWRVMTLIFSAVDAAAAVAGLVRQLVVDDRVVGAHDVSSGGIALALAEMAVRSGFGVHCARIADHVELFGESVGRAVVCVEAASAREVIDLCEAHGVPVTQLGAVMGDRIVVKDLLDIDLAEATTTWRERLPRALGAGTVQA